MFVTMTTLMKSPTWCKVKKTPTNSPDHQTDCVRDRHIQLVSPSCNKKSDLMVKMSKQTACTRYHTIEPIRQIATFTWAVEKISHSVGWFHLVFRWKAVDSFCTIQSTCMCWPNYSAFFCTWLCWIICGKRLSLYIQFYCYNFLAIKWFRRLVKVWWTLTFCVHKNVRISELQKLKK